MFNSFSHISSRFLMDVRLQQFASVKGAAVKIQVRARSNTRMKVG